MIASASPNYNPGFPPCARDAISPRSRITPRVTALAVGETRFAGPESPPGATTEPAGCIPGIAASPTAVAATRLRSGTVGHNNMRLDFNARSAALRCLASAARACCPTYSRRPCYSRSGPFPLSLRDGFVAADRLDLAGRVELIAQPLSGQTTRQFQCDHARSAVARAASVARSPRPSSAGVSREARAADPSWTLARIDTGCPSDVAPGLSSRPSTRRSGVHVRPRRQPSSHFATRGHNVDHAQLDSGNRLEGTQGG